jgi:hypothetical protein
VPGGLGRAPGHQQGLSHFLHRELVQYVHTYVIK